MTSTEDISVFLKKKTFQTFSCTPFHSFKFNSSSRLRRARLLTEFLVKTGQFISTKDAVDLNIKRNAEGYNMKRLISVVQFSEITNDMLLPDDEEVDEETDQNPVYKLIIGTGNESNPKITEFYFFPSKKANQDPTDDFQSYPLLLCKGDADILLYVREWLQVYFHCSIVKNNVSAQILVNFISWYSQMLYNVTSNEYDDTYNIFKPNAITKLEYYLPDLPELQHITINIKAHELVQLEGRVNGTDATIIEAIEEYLLMNGSINIGALTLRTVITSAMAFHLDGKLKFLDGATPTLILWVLGDLVREIEDSNLKFNQSE